jgi:hypothetical protein
VDQSNKLAVERLCDLLARLIARKHIQEYRSGRGKTLRPPQNADDSK